MAPNKKEVTYNKNAYKNKQKQRRSMNNSYNLINSNLNNLHIVDINSPNWNISPGNTNPEKIPASLNYKPVVPKMKLPAFLQGKGRSRQTRRRRVTKRATRRIKRKN